MTLCSPELCEGTVVVQMLCGRSSVDYRYVLIVGIVPAVWDSSGAAEEDVVAAVHGRAEVNDDSGELITLDELDAVHPELDDVCW